MKQSPSGHSFPVLWPDRGCGMPSRSAWPFMSGVEGGERAVHVVGRAAGQQSGGELAQLIDDLGRAKALDHLDGSHRGIDVCTGEQVPDLRRGPQPGMPVAFGCRLIASVEGCPAREPVQLARRAVQVKLEFLAVAAADEQSQDQPQLGLSQAETILAPHEVVQVPQLAHPAFYPLGHLRIDRSALQYAADLPGRRHADPPGREPGSRIRRQQQKRPAIYGCVHALHHAFSHHLSPPDGPCIEAVHRSPVSASRSTSRGRWR